MRLIRGIDRRLSAAPNPPFRPMRRLVVLSTVILGACTGDGVVAPELNPAPEPAVAAAQPVIRLRCGMNNGIAASDPVIHVVDGNPVAEDVFRAITPTRIASIEVRRKNADRPVHEIHITLHPSRR